MATAKPKAPKKAKKPTLADRLKKLGACEDGVAWARPFESASAAWLKCEDVAWMIWSLEETGWKNDSLLRKFACACVRETPLADGRKVFDLLADERSRTAVDVAERFADGNATEEELAAAGAAAWAAAGAAARDAAGVAAWAAARDAAGAAALDAAWAAAWAAALDAALDAARAAARASQCKILRRIVGNPFKGE